MAGPAFQLIGDIDGDAGELGFSELGFSSLGGGAYPIYELPSLQPGSDRLDKPGHVFQSKNTHEVGGIVVGERLYAEVYKWRTIWLSIPTEDHDQIISFFRARRFKLLPDADVSTVYWVVLYRGSLDLFFPHKRGSIHDIDAELQQLTGPAAQV